MFSVETLWSPAIRDELFFRRKSDKFLQLRSKHVDCGFRDLQGSATQDDITRTQGFKPDPKRTPELLERVP